MEKVEFFIEKFRKKVDFLFEKFKSLNAYLGIVSSRTLKK